VNVAYHESLIGELPYEGGAIAFKILSAAIYPWYFIWWALPYALSRRRVLGYLLVCFPFVTELSGLSLFMRVWQLNIVLPLVVIASLTFGSTTRSRTGKTHKGC
jgi:hypothetical protein